MYTITNTHRHGIQLTNAAGETLTVGTLEDMIALRAELDAYLQKRGQTEYISTFQARRLAMAEGHTIPTNSITAACEQGRITHAKKLKGRWQMPVPAWERWYAEWKLKKASKAEEDDE